MPDSPWLNKVFHIYIDCLYWRKSQSLHRAHLAILAENRVVCHRLNTGFTTFPVPHLGLVAELFLALSEIVVYLYEKLF